MPIAELSEGAWQDLEKNGGLTVRLESHNMLKVARCPSCGGITGCLKVLTQFSDVQEMVWVRMEGCDGDLCMRIVQITLPAESYPGLTLLCRT